MKLKLFIFMVVLLFIHGCNSGSSPVSEGENSITEVSDGSDEEEPLRKIVAGWYMRTVAKATLSDGTEYIHKTAGVMGEFKESQDGKDRHDIYASGNPVLSVLFIQNDWEEEDNGNYFSDYRAYSENDQRQVWTIQVKNNTSAVDLTNAPIKLTLDGPYSILEEDDEGRIKYNEVLSSDQSKKQMMVLVDVDYQREYTYEELQSEELSMNGLATRTFRWVLGVVEQSDYEPLRVVKPLAVNVSLKSAKEINTLDPDDKFGLPPSF